MQNPLPIDQYKNIKKYLRNILFSINIFKELISNIFISCRKLTPFTT